VPLFLTFGDERYEEALRRVEKEALASGFFDRIVVKRPADLGSAFWKQHGSFVHANRRGYGLWIWKPWLILEALRSCEPDDFLVYLDAGCTINERGRARFEDYCRRAAASAVGALGFQLPLLEKSYTKGDLFERLHAWHLKDTRQVRASIVVIQCRAESIRFAEEWLALAEDHPLISDEPSSVSNDPSFLKHRHDQSIFSLLSKLRGATLIEDETEFADWNDATDKPFWVTRLRGKQSGPFRRLRRDLAVRWHCARHGVWRP
jgi:hypothetical protein